MNYNNYTLSSALSHSGFLAGRIVNIKVAINKTAAEINVNTNCSNVPLLITSTIPPIQIIVTTIGKTYFTIKSHHLPNFNVLLLEFKKSMSFSALNIHANTIHSATTPIRIAI